MSHRPPTYCPACREDVAVEEGCCIWCGSTTRRRRGKPVGVHGKLSDDQLRILHAMHIKRGASIRELARAVLATTGYASEGSAVEGIRHGWKRLELRARPRGEMVRLTNERRRHPQSPGSVDRAAAKRFYLRRAGGYRKCQGFKSTYPEKGRPCTRYALAGSDFCLQHDPARREEVLAIVGAARAVSPNGVGA